MITAPSAPFLPLATWAWRLLPVCALVAAAAIWSVWSHAEENEFVTRSALEAHSEEWAFIKRVTGKTLGR